MGKRRDRRIAAQMAAGRRVKLDLFTEPSGDLVGASRHDEVGGDLDQNSYARAPNSPSSPAGKCCFLGQKRENPLLLLGQYSDDELEEEEKKEPKPSAEESSSVNQKEVEEPVDIERDRESNGGHDVTSPGVKQDNTDGDLDPLNAVKYVDNNDIGSSDSTALKPYSEVDSMAEVSSSGNSGSQIDQDATGEWKIVMHEESSGYYYWNTVTGETSWEAPDMLAQRMEAPGEKKLSPVIEESGSVLLDAHASSSDLIANLEVHGNASLFDRPMNANLIPDVKEHCESGFEMEIGNVGTKDENIQVVNDNCIAISVSYMEASALIDSVSNQQSDLVNSGIEGSTSRSMELPVAVNVVEKNDHPIVSKEYAEASHVHSVRLITLGENLLQKLKVLEGSGEQTQALDRRLKYISEIEVRLSDCKALASYGSSLLPFWWHTETQLMQLELAIGKEAVPQSARHELLDKVETFHISSRDDDASQQTMGTASGVGGKDKGLLSSTFENACASTDTADASELVQNQVDHLVHNEDDKPKYGLSSGFLGSEPGEIAPRAKENLVPVSLDHKTESHAGDAADMDVDMEVDNETSEYHDVPIDASCNAQLEQPVHSNTTLPSLDVTTSDPVEKFSAPPPPDEEWIPPPPPDNEPIPPPPPDEPPTPLFPLPPPYAESTPALPYAEQYSFAYTVPSYEYYAPAVTEVNNSTYYAPTESCQNVEPQPLPYYESAANMFPEGTPPVVTPVTSVVYYDLPNGAVPSEPVINSLESSSFYSESGSVSYQDNVASDYTGSIGVAPESGYAQIPSLKVQSDFYTSSSETDMVTVKGSSISTASYTSEAAIVNESAADPLPTADAKNPPKVVRNKKRTIAAPTLRSNRKVSSLVDKWKAAKEELHGDKEDEPEDPYERLEKKRQRQIEEWRAQQIASGEARDNANFQPLGGDWRERVKRKRSESSSKSIQNPSREDVNEQQHPNLIELSKDLPSGWQAYWDESSKQVYYGNAVTSETSWTRPTN